MRRIGDGYKKGDGVASYALGGVSTRHERNLKNIVQKRKEKKKRKKQLPGVSVSILALTSDGVSRLVTVEQFRRRSPSTDAISLAAEAI